MDRTLRAQVRQRAGNRCEYCGLPQEVAPFPIFHVEHILPRKHGGGDESSNLCLACNHCNLHKGCNLSGRDPETGAVTRLFNPRVDRWSEHFKLERASIIGLTATGRTTLRVLNMNDAERVELRLEALELGRL
jgi:5-methylcytosine-specific restriction endonuclease McrA